MRRNRVGKIEKDHLLERVKTDWKLVPKRILWVNLSLARILYGSGCYSEGRLAGRDFVPRSCRDRSRCGRGELLGPPQSVMRTEQRGVPLDRNAFTSLG